MIDMEQISDVETIYQGKRFKVKMGTLLTKSGNQIKRDFITHPGAAVVLPFMDDVHILMIRNERHAIGKEIWELPAGCLEPEELPSETAKRELIEETGYEAAHLELLMKFYSSPGFCNEFMHAYVARQLKFVGSSLEDSENINVEIIPLLKALDMIRQGTIEDAKTIACLLYYQTFNS